jgi:S1-C subfamily serine protease
VSSDESYTYATLAEEKPAGTALITQAGDLYGIVREDTQVIPMQHIAPLLKDIFTGNEITRTRLGVHMIDLSLIDASWDEGQLQHVKTGALIIGDAKRPAIKKDSAAAKAGLQEGDVIKRVEKTDVNEDHRLPQILAEYAPGTQVTITILRDSIEQEVEVTLQ